MKIKESPKELRERFKKHSGMHARGFGNPNKKALKKGIDVRFNQINAFLESLHEELQSHIAYCQAEIEVRLDQIEELIKDLHEKELGV